jgi:cytochrome c oxidase subunit 1
VDTAGNQDRDRDAKRIGLMHLVTAFGFFIAAGFMALLMRAELARPGLQFLSTEQYNQCSPIHGTVMMFLFATPLVFAFGNHLVPLQIGAPDVSFPRLNNLAYWLYLFGGLLVVGGFATPDRAADFGWTAYANLSRDPHTPGVGGNLWIVGPALSGLGTIFGAVNMTTTILTLRAPGMTMFRMPILTWNILRYSARRPGPGPGADGSAERASVAGTTTVSTIRGHPSGPVGEHLTAGQLPGRSGAKKPMVS